MTQATKKRRIEEDDQSDTEARLERLLFGSAIPTKEEGIKKLPLSNEDDLAKAAVDDLFVIDTVGDRREGEFEDEENDRHLESSDQVHIQVGAWADSDDENVKISLKSKRRLRKLRKTEEDDEVTGVNYEKRLRSQFEKTYPTPLWAIIPEEENEVDEVDELFRNSRTLLGRDATLLPPTEINIQRVVDANRSKPSTMPIHAIEFHPTAPILLTAGADKCMRLFEIDGKSNPLLHSQQLSDMSIYNASFHPSGETVLLTGRAKHLYIYDLKENKMMYKHGILSRGKNNSLVDYHRSLEKFSLSPCGRYVAFLGRDGHISVCSWKTMQVISSFKMNGNVSDLTWNEDGTRLSTVGGHGDVYEWDMMTRRCVKRWKDEGEFNVVSIASTTSKHDGRKYIACGAEAGVVSVYDMEGNNGKDNGENIEKWRPLKTFMNITTPIDFLKYNHDGQILAMSSRDKKDAMRLVHMPSMSVFGNWPTNNTPLGKVTSVAFSAQSEYIAIGNHKGRVPLYRLMHFNG